MDLYKLLKSNPFVPVAAFRNADEALRSAELLLKHSVTVLEITLRTDAAYESLRAVSSSFKEMSLAAGSVLDPEQLERARDAGALFGVSPALDEAVLDEADGLGVPFIPGVATPSELARALKRTSVIKLFPAATLGGVDYIKAVCAPFRLKQFHLVPTGGVNDKNYLQYLAADKVIAVGMSYPVESSLLEKGDFAAVDERIGRIVDGLMRP